MKISYAITVCNEIHEIERLIPFLHKHIRLKDEICVLLDKPKASQSLLDVLYWYSSKDWIVLKESEFHGHFANWKNELTSLCNGDYIFQIDADEIPNENLIAILPEILEENDEVDVFLVPRVNTVEGLTPEHIAKWGWRVTDTGSSLDEEWVNWPDYQWRIWKNIPEIQWVNKVHERLNGFNQYTAMPDVEYFALYHPKTIERQEKQNQYYNTL